MRHATFRHLAVIAFLALVIAACGDDDATSTSASVVETTEAAHDEGEAAHDEGPALRLNAGVASITVDGDASDWEGIEGLDMTLEGISTEQVDAKDIHVKAAYDDEFFYLLLTVEDDFDWVEGEARLSASSSVMWMIGDGAGAHMGTESEGEQESYESLGMVDIWHWELECALGESQGGSVSDSVGGNDPGCNFDDEWATDPAAREDDNGEGAENSLLGVFSHSNPVPGGEGTWTFEMSRPLQTGDAQDAQFGPGTVASMALAYWDADNTATGWNDAEHVQSSYLGWIEVMLAG